MGQHFEQQDFFKNQIYDEGYFSYEKDGFGPVCYDFEKTVDEIINLIQNDCELEPKYRGRIDNFYAFNDSNNCERIYKATPRQDLMVRRIRQYPPCKSGMATRLV